MLIWKPPSWQHQSKDPGNECDSGCPATYRPKVRSLKHEVQCPKKNIGSRSRHIARCTATYTLGINIALKDMNVGCWTEIFESKIWILIGNAENKDVRLHCKHIAFYTVQTHWTSNKIVTCSNHVAFEIWTLNCEWAMLNCRSWIFECENEQ